MPKKEVQRRAELPFKEGIFPSYANVSYVNQIEDELIIIDFAFVDPLEINVVSDEKPLTGQIVSRVIMSRKALISLAAEIREVI